MTQIEDYHFEDQEVVLDHSEFRDCTFESCDIVFYGHGPTSLEGCEFIDTSFSFQGAAGITLDFLQDLFAAPPRFQVMVIGFLDQIVGNGDSVARLPREDGEDLMVLVLGEATQELHDALESSGGKVTARYE